MIYFPDVLRSLNNYR